MYIFPTEDVNDMYIRIPDAKTTTPCIDVDSSTGTTKTPRTSSLGINLIHDALFVASFITSMLATTSTGLVLDATLISKTLSLPNFETAYIRLRTLSEE